MELREEFSMGGLLLDEKIKHERITFLTGRLSTGRLQEKQMVLAVGKIGVCTCGRDLHACVFRDLTYKICMSSFEGMHFMHPYIGARNQHRVKPILVCALLQAPQKRIVRELETIYVAKGTETSYVAKSTDMIFIQMKLFSSFFSSNICHII